MKLEEKIIKNNRTSLSVGYGYVTDYRYNALGEVTQTQTPDGGLTEVVYNRAGLVRFSRNARQALLNTYTYTKYDVLGRTVESGEATGGLPTESHANDSLYPSSGVRGYVVRTKYTEPTSGYGTQRHLRSRVSWVEIDKDGNAATTGDIARSVYSYDPHGNVEWVVHDLPAGYVAGSVRVSAKVEYEYDLVSGKVLKLKYQSGKADNFYTRYTYDSDNRIRSVETSRDGVVWERDAEYGYYAHGPLKRVQIGEDGVQGIDYTYTLQGWLKAINHPHASDRSKDPGGDGHGVSRTPGDAFSMALHYFDGDFSRAGSAFNTAGTVEASVRPGAANNLYNGNISGWVQRTMQPSGEASVFAGIYTYDRLNRLRREQRALWGGSAFGAATDVYGSEYAYDPNGNILNLVRKDSSGVQMFDRFRYDYVAGKNRLASVYDSASARFRPGVAGANTDIAPGLRQYSYDATGNVVADGGKAITWTPYGKVESVEKETGAGVVRFLYDAQGNRVLKEETGGGGVVSKRTWYMRDAAGQHLATYEHTDTTVAPRAKEYLLYGSGRLGTVYADNANGGAAVSGPLYCRVVGKKQYELSDHLGNVRATVGDVKVRSGSTFAARVESFTEYFAFGMEAKSGGSGGRFGFNGMEKDNEVKGGGNHVDFGARYLDVRTGVWGSCDPLEHRYAPVSPYVFALSNPVWNIDPDGKAVINLGGALLDLMITLSEMAGLDDLKMFREGGLRQNDNVYLGLMIGGEREGGEWVPGLVFKNVRIRQSLVVHVPTVQVENNQLIIGPGQTYFIQKPWRKNYIISNLTGTYTPLTGAHSHILHLDAGLLNPIFDPNKIEKIDDVSDKMIDLFLGAAFIFNHEVRAHLTETRNLYGQDADPDKDHALFGNTKITSDEISITSIYEKISDAISEGKKPDVVPGSSAAEVLEKLFEVYNNPEKREQARKVIFDAIQQSKTDKVIQNFQSANDQ